MCIFLYVSVFIMNRYKEPDTCNLLTHEAVEQTHLLSQNKQVSIKSILCQLFNCRAVQEPTFLSSAISSVNIFILCKYNLTFTVLLHEKLLLINISDNFNS